MQISNNNQLNFNGTYRFRKINEDLKNKITKLVDPRDCKIITNVADKDDFVLSAHNDYDLKLSKFIENQHLKFEYFPRIVQSKNLTNKSLTSLIKRDIKSGKTVSNPAILRFKLLKTRPAVKKQQEYMSNAINTLRLNVEKPKVNYTDRGYLKIRDDVKQRTMYLGHHHYGKMYMAVVPDSLNESIERYYLINNGKKLVKKYETPHEIDTFNKFSCIDYK